MEYVEEKQEKSDKMQKEERCQKVRERTTPKKEQLVGWIVYLGINVFERAPDQRSLRLTVHMQSSVRPFHEFALLTSS